MISRAAENLYWLHRYMERLEGMSRLLHTTTSMMLDVEEANRWRSVLIASGEQATFKELFGAGQYEEEGVVQKFLVWDERSGASLMRSLSTARENARTTREAISREVWEVTNYAFLWMKSPDARRQFDEDLLGFYRRIRGISHEFRGASISTMMHDEPLDFMELGMFLERADQTARALDVKHHMLGSQQEGEEESTIERVAWISTLLTCSGLENYFKIYHRGVTGRCVAEFLVLNPKFPRSVLYCLNAALVRMERIHARNGAEGTETPHGELLALRNRLQSYSIDEIVEIGIHDLLSGVVQVLAVTSQNLHPRYFEPALQEEQTQAQTQTQTQAQPR